MFYLNYRLNPQTMLAEGIQVRREMNFISRYGVLERVTRYYPDDDNICSKGRKGATVTREKPGVSPAIFSNHLMGSTVFLNLEDIALDLPELTEEVVPVETDGDLAAGTQTCQECHMKGGDHYMPPDFNKRDELSARLKESLRLEVQTLAYTYHPKEDTLLPMVVVKTKITSKAGHRIPDG